METTVKVQVFGVGCSRCKLLEEKVRQLVVTHHLNVSLEIISDINEIINYGIMSTPGLVIGGKVKSAGTVPKDTQLLQWLKE